MRTGRFNATGMKTALRFKLVVAVTALSTMNGAAKGKPWAPDCCVQSTENAKGVLSRHTKSVIRERVYHAKNLEFVCISSTGGNSASAVFFIVPQGKTSGELTQLRVN